MKTLTLCKTKTLEYRLLRKLREKLKNLLTKDLNNNSNNNIGDKTYNKYKQEVN